MPATSQPTAHGNSLLEALQRGQARATVSFAGQGVGWIDGLAALDRQLPTVRALVDAADATLRTTVADRAFAWSGQCPNGFALAQLLRRPETRPPAEVLSSSVVSQPGILLAQAARWQWLLSEGFDAAVLAGAVQAATGHSQGVMAALLCAEHGARDLDPARVAQYAQVMAWQGLTMAQSAGQRGRRQGEATAMAAVSGPTAQVLQSVLDRVAGGMLGADQPVLSLWNTRTRHVVSAAPATLLRLQEALTQRAADQQKARKEGRLGGKPLAFTWEWLDVGAPFHGPAMAAGLDAMRAALHDLGFAIAPLHFPVLSSSSGLPYDAATVLGEVMQDEFIRPVRWVELGRALAERADTVLDLGPGDGVAKLTMSNLRGRPVRVLPVDVAEGQRQLLDGAGPGALPLDYRSFAPQLRELPDGEVVADNAFSRACGLPPVLLPGMTPTTSDAPIVAAAANAGYWAELAGGGQPSARIFDLRVQELAELLQPGRGFWLNLLYLDPYLWDLQVVKGLAVRARQRGVPLLGLVVSAGIPPVDEAARWVRKWRTVGIEHIAFKPGTAAQIDQVCKIALAVPETTLYAHIEGGKAGGHHSWEDLEELLLDSYAKIRANQNLVLCAGGGIATEDRAVELLTGAWSRRHGVADMPVDAVFLGTLAMACREATATAAVKQALVAARGTDRWVHAGAAAGGITSGKSQLGADIHYLDNHAARVGRLLDQVAGDAAAVAARRDEIVSALAGTAKPYFGDVQTMTWAQVLERIAQTMAPGLHGRYDDGAWLDPSWRARALDLFARAEARLAGMAGTAPRIRWQAAAELDNPDAALHDLCRHYPQAASEPLHPADATYFVQVCSRPGKPVPFVPLLDENVRRWYKSDALWQAQDDRYPADACLIIPGPEAVAGIARADEPVAELLGRFDRALLAHLAQAGQRPVATARVGSGARDRWAALAANDAGAVGAVLAGAPWWADKAPGTDLWRALCPADADLQVHVERDSAGRLARVQVLDCGGETVQLVADGPDCARVEARLAGSPAAPVFGFAVRRERLGRGGERLVVDPAAYADGVQDLYQALVADQTAGAVALFDSALDTVQLPTERAAAWAALCGGDGAAEAPALDLGFALVWRGLFRAMASAELRGGWLRLLHAEHAVQAVTSDRPRAGAPVQTVVRAVRVEDGDIGRSVTLRGEVTQGAAQLTVTTRLVIRGLAAPLRSAWVAVPADRPIVAAANEPVSAALAVDVAALDVLRELPWLTLDAKVVAGDRLILQAERRELVLADGQRWHAGHGTLHRDGQQVGTVALSGAWQRDGEHPLQRLVAALAESSTEVPTPKALLAEATVRAPADALPFSGAGGDFNPIHHSVLAARLAGLSSPIVHGMWTAARACQFAAQAAGVPESHVRAVAATFSAPVPLGAALHLTASRVAVQRGHRIVEVAVHLGNNGPESARARYDIAPVATAYVFPGQGVQQQGMGMAGFARSKAARAVWERADAFTRAELGFSVLDVVRLNPKVLVVRGQRLVHPDGVLQLTQFTQVAMAVLAMAQVAELRGAGVLDETAATCGHSVGEYNALAAYTEVLPPETVIDIVWQRGNTMHTVVPRDAQGKSAYAMGVVRPNLAGLDHAGAEALVAEVAAGSGQFIQIVNHNVRDRQYSVTGELGALAALQAELARRQPAGSKPAWITVPGLDVPFHSRVLHTAVPVFRAVLDRRLPTSIDPHKLVGRYIPNLVARPFALDDGFVRAVLDATGSPELAQVLRDRSAWQGRDPQLARLLLVELLAWQFASPVRWIETQDRLFAPRDQGGLGIARLVEVGPGHQPTLANMARTTLQNTYPPIVQVLNAEADFDTVMDRGPGLEVAAGADSGAGAGSGIGTGSGTGTGSGGNPPPAAAPRSTPAPAPVMARAAAGPVGSHPIGHADALRALLALQARVRPEQLTDAESMEDVFEGVSSRRNQALADMAAEFGVGALDGAADKPMAALAGDLARKAAHYKAPGKYLKAAIDDTVARLFGKAGLQRRDAVAWLDSQWGLDEPSADHVLLHLALLARPGDSVRGGVFGDAQPAGAKTAAQALLDKAALAWAQARGVGLQPQSAASGGGGAVVDSAALDALKAEILGEHGILADAARATLERLGHAEAQVVLAGDADSKLAALQAELGPAFAELCAPAFDPKKHAVFASAWAWAQTRLLRAYFDLVNGRAQLDATRPTLRYCAAFADDRRVADTARWCATQLRQRGQTEAADAFADASRPRPLAPLPVAATRPVTTVASDGSVSTSEVADAERAAEPVVLDLRGQAALVTGASPGSIAVELVKHLLWAGAKVVATTSSFDDARQQWYRRLYQEHAGPGAELHVVPYNAASAQDTAALVAWLHGPAGLPPDLCAPFAAPKDGGTLDQLGDKAEAAARAMLWHVQKLVAGLGAATARRADAAAPCHVLLPLSPNHGQFGGDGLYAESKLGLETLLRRWHSEHAAWGSGTSLVGVRIGWVRGTGLMDAHDQVAAGLEAKTGVRTWSTGQMGAAIAHLCRDDVRSQARSAPVDVDLTSGFAAIANVGEVVTAVRVELQAAIARAQRAAQLRTQLAPTAPTILPPAALPDWPAPLLPAGHPATFAPPRLPLNQLIVIVGMGELNPCGTTRTRFALEAWDDPDAAAVIELAWLCGLVRWDEAGGWRDVSSSEPVAEADLATRYLPQLRTRVGIRPVDPKTAGFDPRALDSYVVAYLDRPIAFEVPNQAEAQAYVTADPAMTTAHPNADGTWRVHRKQGAEVRVPKTLALTRHVAGLLPDGLDLRRLGIPADLRDTVDPVTQMNLCATADAFASAGLQPEELLHHLHPAHIANTQGSGIGGMKSLHKLYVDPVLGRDRQGDALQETLINVVGAYAVQAYVGGYGSMSHPVAACATAAVSMESAVDKILLGRAEFVVAGGYDDYGPEGAIGFSDMQATADSVQMEQAGIAPKRMSRPNDLRRKGFVEAQGGGTFLLTRGDIAQRLGLPVYAVCCYTASHADGVHRSIPAPGQGVLSVAMGGINSPIAKALFDHGLCADDIAVVSKHDTSTGANDPNESRVHDRIQQAIGRTPGNPLLVVSQKSLTGHSKGGAAAWQLGGLIQVLTSGRIPGNRNLDSVDPALRDHRHLCWTNEALQAGPGQPLKAGLVTSLGFGHVGALVLLAHPGVYEAALSPAERATWQARAEQRLRQGRRRLAQMLMGGKPLFERRSHRRFDAHDGTPAQFDAEAQLLVDADARLGDDDRFGEAK